MPVRMLMAPFFCDCVHKKKAGFMLEERKKLLSEQGTVD
jgi:hypothetical protein